MGNTKKGVDIFLSCSRTNDLNITGLLVISDCVYCAVFKSANWLQSLAKLYTSQTCKICTLLAFKILHLYLPLHSSHQAYNFQIIFIYIKPKNDIAVCVCRVDILFYIFNTYFVLTCKEFKSDKTQQFFIFWYCNIEEIEIVIEQIKIS